jgi:TPR repeat protein
VQQKVEQLYQNGEYERALFIYENELAPVGDKYAQYMVGFMHLTGTGTEEDPVAASAWYRLAAERSYPEFVTVRDQLLAAFTEPDRLRSDYEYRELRRKYSDLVILERLIREDLKLLEPLTGSRLSGSTRAVTILEPRSGLMVSAEQLRVRARARIEERLRQIDALIDDVDIETDPDRLDPALLREQVNAAVERLDDRAEDSGR